MKTIVVVGGGITGLSTMYYLQRIKQEQKLDLELLLVEANEYLGGKIHTIEKDGFMMETGADSIVARNQNVLPFIKDLHLENELVYNATGTSYIHTKDRLLQIPKDSIFGIPMTVEALFTSELISKRGKLEALKDVLTGEANFTKDSSIGEFLEYHLGKEIVEKQIAPVLAGVYSGSIYSLTMASTLPYLIDYKAQYGSIIRGLGKHKKEFQSAADKKFISFKNGLSTIINRLEEVLTDVTVLKGVSVTTIEKYDEQYTLKLSNQETRTVDSIVITTPYNNAQKMLKNKDLDEEFQQLKNSSNITLYLSYDISDQQLPKDGTGFIVAEDSDLICNACTWTSRKWKHTSTNGKLLLRLFYKKTNPHYEALNAYSEEELIKVAKKDIERSLGITTDPISYEVTKWNELMPVYSLNHKNAVNSLTNKLEKQYPNVLLAGSSYYGVGIAACIANGEVSAKKVTNSLGN